MNLALIVNIVTGVIGFALVMGIIYVIYNSRKKKNKFKTEETKNKDSVQEKYAYRVTIADPFGSSIREIATFGAHKVRNDTGILVIKNEEKKFEEYFPLDEKNEVQFSLEEVKKKLKSLRNYKPKGNENPLNVQSEIFKWEKLEKLLEYPAGSFLKIDKDGTPHYIFVRYRSVFVPFKWNLDMTHVHAPSEPLTKDIIDSREEKRKKYIEKLTNMQQLLGVATIVIGLVLICIGGFWNYKLYNMADENNVAQLQKRIDMSPIICAELYGKAGENFMKASSDAVKTTAQATEILDRIRDDVYTNQDLVKKDTTQVVN